MRPVGGLAVGGPVRTFLSDFFLRFKKKVPHEKLYE
jgi:hypothetical protein